MLAQSDLPIAFAVPYGDQMLAGAWGMIRAVADLLPDWAEEIIDGIDGRRRSEPMVIQAPRTAAKATS